VALLKVPQVAAEEDRLDQGLPQVGGEDRDAGDRKQHAAEPAVVERRGPWQGRRGKLTDHERELSVPMPGLRPIGWSGLSEVCVGLQPGQSGLSGGFPVDGKSCSEFKKNEAAPAADTASTGKATGDTLMVLSAPLYGRCLLWEANLCVNCRWSRTENE